MERSVNLKNLQYITRRCDNIYDNVIYEGPNLSSPFWKYTCAHTHTRARRYKSAHALSSVFQGSESGFRDRVDWAKNFLGIGTHTFTAPMRPIDTPWHTHTAPLPHIRVNIAISLQPRNRWTQLLVGLHLDEAKKGLTSPGIQLHQVLVGNQVHLGTEHLDPRRQCT